MPSTSRGYPYPSGSDDVDIPGDMQALAAAVNTDVGTVVTNAVQHSLADAAGDIIVASANDAWARKALGTDNHVLTVDTSGSGAAKVAWEDPTANPLTVAAMAAKVNTATVGNLLTANLANGSESGSITADEPGDCSVASSTAQAKSGTRSIAQTAAAAYCYARMMDTAGFTAGQTYTFSAQARANASGETAELTILWRDNGGAGIGGTISVAAAVVSTAWTRIINTAVAPAGAVTATIYLGKSGANGTVLYWDELGAWQGAGGQWALPGTPITNLGFYTDESVGRRLFQWDANNARWQQTYSDSGLRDTAVTVANSWAIYGGYNHIRRVGNVVSLNLWLDSTSASSDTIGTIPSGFRPDRSLGLGILAPVNAIRFFQVSSAGNISADRAGITPNPGWFIQATWVTSDAWPTTLPGSAVGSIPA